jgi:hypothetical protein
MISALPATLAISMTPALLKPTTTVVDIVCPASASRFEVPGSATPSGQSVKKVVALTLATVRLSTMAVAPLGMAPPVTCHVSDS